MLPSQVAKAYNFPAGRSLQNQCIAIIELGGGFNPLDVVLYCKKNGFPIPEIHIASVDGSIPIETGPTGPDGEVNLDLDVIALAAPGTKLLVVFCPNSEQGFVDGINTAINHSLNPCAISLSWGASLDNWSVAGRQAIDTAINLAKSKDIPVFVAAGDNGSNDGTSSPILDYPSCSPNAISCGGTNLQLSDNSQTAWTEDAAGDNGSTGGGFTTLYPTSAFQVNKAIKPGRNCPDIAGNADPNTGYDIDVDGISMVVGGTSAVAPLYAALWAIIVSRLGQKVGGWHEALYNNPGTYTDIVGGNNGAYLCTSGYDLCTGLGSINGESLLAVLAKINSITILDPIPAVSSTLPLPVIKMSLWQQIINNFKKLFGINSKFAKKHIIKK